MSDTHGASRGPHSKGSRALHHINDLAGRTFAAVTAAVLTVVFLIVGAFLQFSHDWFVVFEVVGTSVTFIMVFVIQHTQARHQTAVQLKLDELLRALPQASNELIHVELAAEAELEEREQTHTDLRNEAVDRPESD